MRKTLIFITALVAALVLLNIASYFIFVPYFAREEARRQIRGIQVGGGGGGASTSGVTERICTPLEKEQRCAPANECRETLCFAMDDPQKELSSVCRDFPQYLKVDNLTSASAFGFSMATDGDILVVGDPGKELNGFERVGEAYIYRKDAGEWRLQQVLEAPNLDSEPDDEFGYQVAVHGGIVAVSQRRNDENSKNNGGAVYVYTQDELTEQWTLNATLFDTSASVVGTIGERFGTGLQVHGRTLAAGSPFGTFNGSLFLVGTVTVFKLNDQSGLWEEKAFLASAQPQTFGFFGFSLDIQDGTLVVGESGAFSVYEEQSDETWELRHRVLPTLANTTATFGQIVKLDGNTIAVSEPGYTLNNSLESVGRVHLYTSLATNATFSLSQVLETENPAFSGSFGRFLTLRANYLAISAFLENYGGTYVNAEVAQLRSQSGRIYTYRRADDQSLFEREDIIGSPTAEGGDECGSTLVISSDDQTLFVRCRDDSATQDDPFDNSIENAGGIWVYTCDSLSPVSETGFRTDFQCVDQPSRAAENSFCEIVINSEEAILKDFEAFFDPQDQEVPLGVCRQGICYYESASVRVCTESEVQVRCGTPANACHRKECTVLGRFQTVRCYDVPDVAADGQFCDDGLDSTIEDQCFQGQCRGAFNLPDPTPPPSAAPTLSPTPLPTASPSSSPTRSPTTQPTPAPAVPTSSAPSLSPTLTPSAAPSVSPTVAPSTSPTAQPTLLPTLSPTFSPTAAPTNPCDSYNPPCEPACTCPGSGGSPCSAESPCNDAACVVLENGLDASQGEVDFATAFGGATCAWVRNGTQYSEFVMDGISTEFCLWLSEGGTATTSILHNTAQNLTFYAENTVLPPDALGSSNFHNVYWYNVTGMTYIFGAGQETIQVCDSTMDSIHTSAGSDCVSIENTVLQSFNAEADVDQCSFVNVAPATNIGCEANVTGCAR